MAHGEPQGLYGPVTSQHLAAETAHLAARLAWLWPDDHTRRLDAVTAWHAVGKDYLGTMATFIESTGGKASNDTAAKWLADHMRGIAEQLYVAMVTANASPLTIPAWVTDAAQGV